MSTNKPESSQFAKIGVVSIYKNAGKTKTSYRLRWYVDNKQVKITVNHANIATTIAAQIDTDISNGIYHPKEYYDPKKKIAKLVIDENYRYLDYLWLEWKKIEHEYAPNSLDKHKRIDTILRHANKLELRLDNAHKLLEFMRMGYSDATIYRDLNPVIACVNYWVKLGKVKHNPYPAIKAQLRPKKLDNKGRFTADERARILRALRGDDTLSFYADICHFLFYTGLRPSEVIPLTWGDLDREKGVIKVTKTYSKGQLRNNTKQGKKGKIVHRVHKMSDSAEAVVENIFNELIDLNIGINSGDLIFVSPENCYINWRNFTRRIWNPLINDLVSLGKVKKYLKPYCMRHTYITNEIKHNTPLHIIAAQVGTSIEMLTKVYLISNEWWIDSQSDLSKYKEYAEAFK